MTDNTVLNPISIDFGSTRRLEYGSQMSDGTDCSDAVVGSSRNVKQLYLQSLRRAGDLNVHKNWAREISRGLRNDDATDETCTAIIVQDGKLLCKDIMYWGLKTVSVRAAWAASDAARDLSYAISQPNIDPDEIVQFVSLHGSTPFVEIWSKLRDRMSGDALNTLARTLSEVIPGSVANIQPRSKTTHPQHSQQSFLTRAQRLDTRGQTDAALDIIYDRVDEQLRNGEFNRLDSFLAVLDVSKYSTDILLGVLASTLPAKSKLPSRKAFFEAVRNAVESRGENEDGLFTGLES